MPIALPTPTAKQLSNIDSDIPAVRAAQSIAMTIAAAARLLKPRTVATIAQALRPDLPLPQVLAELQISADKVLAEITAFNATADAVENEEDIRLKPIMHRATTRFFELMSQIPVLTRNINDFPRFRAAKVERLIAAGLSLEVAEREAGEQTPWDLMAEREAAQIEHDALQQFIKTKDESLLPEGFTANPDISSKGGRRNGRKAS